MEKYLNLEIEEANDDYWNACKNNNLNVVEFLIKHYPKLDIYQTGNYNKSSIFKLIFENDYRDIIDYYIKHKKESFLASHYRSKVTQFNLDIVWAIGVSGNIELLKYLLENYKHDISEKGMKHSLNICLRAASCEGQIDLVKFLLLSHEIPTNAQLPDDNYYAYQVACQKGHIDLVKYYLNNTDLKYRPKASTYNHHGPRTAAWNNHFELLEYFLTSDELEEKADIHACNEGYLFAAIRNENIEMLDFLLKSPKLKEHSNLHHKNELAFRTAVKDNKMLVLKYLICDYEIERNEDINKAIKKRKDVQKMFEMGKLYQKLIINLLEKSNKIKKEKI